MLSGSESPPPQQSSRRLGILTLVLRTLQVMKRYGLLYTFTSQRNPRSTKVTNELYLTILPFIHMGQAFGLTEQVLTLFPDRNFATEFFEDEVDGYIATFKHRADKYLVGGHVKKYEIQKETTSDGRVVVRVIQHVGQ